MTEQQIEDGYARLVGALEPPIDVVGRVDRRVAVRRRRRRALVAGSAAVLVVGGVGSAVALSGGADPGATHAADQPPGPVSTLVLTRPDGSTHAFPEVTVRCQGPEGYSEVPGKVILATSPRRIQGDRVLEPFVHIQGSIAKLRDDRTYELSPDGTTPRGLVLFVADTEGAPDGNEVASTAGGSGTVRVLEASCDPEPVLRLEVRSTLVSEEGKQSLELTGSLG